MRSLSKSKLLAFRQCAKRLWLELHRPELRADSAGTEARYRIGNAVGDVARRIYDPQNVGALVDAQAEGFDQALARSVTLLNSTAPIFEAGFAAAGALAFADIMLPIGKPAKSLWRMVEVKSSTTVKDYHRDDAAIQAFVVRAAGVPLTSIALAHIDSGWVYPGECDYRGLLVETDLTAEAFGRSDEVKEWIADAQAVAQLPVEPKICTGVHCSVPFECGFLAYCQSQERQAEFPVGWLPRLQKRATKDFIETKSITDMRDVPDYYLNDVQRRVKAHTLSGHTYFDQPGAAAELAQHRLPAYFLDFETIQFAVPIWKGTRPYSQIPFQFSLHRLYETGELEHREFLDLTGEDPSRAFAAALIEACDETGPVFVYNAGFETARVKELAERFPTLRDPLLAINERVVDLLPIARRHYYHPSQRGSWSIKAVLPAIADDLLYDVLDGVQDGTAAMAAYLEAIAAATIATRKDEIDRQLRNYCSLDTFALVRLWQCFSGRDASVN